MRTLLSRTQIQERLAVVFPRAAFGPLLSNPLAAAAAVAMLYVDAVVPDQGSLPSDATWARPSTCLWMSDAAYSRTGADDRIAWRKAAAQNRKKVTVLLASWGHPHDESWYADNSRETLRDEIFPAWLGYGAMRVRPGVSTTASKPRWALTESFAGLFDPSLSGEDFATGTEAWRASHMEPGARLRIATLQDRDQAAHEVEVRLPNGQTRRLEPGAASLILRDVVQVWAPARLIDPEVLTISEPGQKILLADQARLRTLGLAIDPQTLLPDAVIVDIGAVPVVFWIVEAVATDGPIDEDRKNALIRWAREQRIPPGSCRFLSAFLDRNDAAAKRRLKDLAVGTFAWYRSEPTRELAWYEIGDGSA